VAGAEEFPFRGLVVWLTPEQGGRRTGPPLPRDAWPYCAATAYVPPHTAHTGLASFVLRNFDTGAWRSPAEARSLITANQGDQLVQPGTIIVVTEGAQAVAYFTVQDSSGS
jgi:hypothetical protein